MAKMNLFKSINTGSLIGKYLTGKESAVEADQLHTWLKESAENQKLFNALKEEKNIATSIEEFETHNKELAWEKYKNRVATLSFRKIMLRWQIAAAFFFLIGCSGILAYLNESRISGDNNENYTTVTTANGQSSKIILPDSSVVWINSGTSLSYNTNFATKKRDIRLVGQAFFQIAHNEREPLTVTCNKLKVKVLGTKFDVSAYPNDNMITVVLESGKVKLLHANDKSFAYTLKPGERAEFNTEQDQLSISDVSSNKYTSWKDGFLIFKNDQMKEVLKRLERWYNINIEVKDDKINQLIFNATIENESVEEIFELIKYSCAINYKIIPSKNPEVPVKIIITSKP